MKKFLLLSFLIFIFTTNIMASHIAGADLTYVCLGGNDYQITYTMYRDCYGIAVENPVTINFASSCGNFTVSLYEIPGTGQEITGACPTSPTTCSGGTIYGVQEYVYQGTVTLQPCADWVFYYTNCCRNAAITTTTGGGSDAIYEYAKLNNACILGSSNPCNSSPVFSNKPVTIICNGQQFCFNHGAVEPDGDSLSYHFAGPYISAGTSVTWLAGYSSTQPLHSTPPVTLDPLTGDVCMTPTQNCITIMGVVCEEWRHVGAVLCEVGEIYRDMQISVITCTNNLPGLTGIDSTTNYSMAVCLGDTVDFDIFSSDVDVANHLTISWNNGIPTGTFTITGATTPPYRPKGHFFWIPTSGDVSNAPHCFTVMVHDNACPYFGSQIFGYCITVKGMHVDIGPDTLLCMGESYTVNAVADTNAVNYYWYIDGTLQALPLTQTSITINSTSYPPGPHTVSIRTDDGDSLTICPGADNINIMIVAQPDIHLGADTTLCEGQTLTLDAGPGTIWTWTGQVPGSTQTIVTDPNTTGTYYVTVDGGNGTRCKDSDTIHIAIVDKPVVDLGPDSCSTVPLTLDAGNPGMIYIWTPSAGTQTITANTTGTYSVEVISLPGSSVCVDRDTVNIKIIPDPIVSLGPDTTICRHETIKFDVNNSGSSDYIYNWEPGGISTPYLSVTGFDFFTIQNPLSIIASVTGCKTISDTLILTIIPCDLTVPNVITPNGDGMNDNFVVTNIEYYPGSVLMIFNRWGKKIYESDSYQNDWKGDNHPDGVYYYILNVKDNTPDGINYHGTITIIGRK
jgi:gliding motility-associated-like protein